MQRAQRQADACRDKPLRSWGPLRFNLFAPNSRVATQHKASTENRTHHVPHRPMCCVATRLPSIRNPQSASSFAKAMEDRFRNGLTLIELLVVIVILTTLVAG